MIKFLLAIALGCFATHTVFALPWLHVEGEKIVDEEGRAVLLRGINLGSWLVQEMWMMPFHTQPPKNSDFKPIKDHITLWRTLEARFGIYDTDRIRTAFRNAWLTEKDFAKIKACGLNCVRIPFIHEMTNEPGGLFFWLDKAIDYAERNDLYVILDMHGAPGLQSDKHHTGLSDACELFSNHHNVHKTAEIWAKIAERYKDRSCIAGYDTLNEPMGAPNTQTLAIVHDHIYRAIRKVDSRHIVFIEDGFKGIEHMPHPLAVGWTNVVLSIHAYGHGNSSEEDFLKKLERLTTTLAQHRKIFKVPMYVGEFNSEPHGNSETVKRIIHLFEFSGIHWSFWSYKKVAGEKGKSEMWGLYYPEKKIKRLDPYLDSKKELLKKIKQLRTDRFEANKSLKEIFSEQKVQVVASEIAAEPVPDEEPAFLPKAKTKSKNLK